MPDLPAQRRREGLFFLALFTLTIPAANWLIGHVGTSCVPQGPCLVPVAPGLKAPSGVAMVGLALVLRDLVQRRLGVRASVVAILIGAALSALLAPPALVLASAAAFLLSEAADLLVYTPLQRRRFLAAVVAVGPGGARRRQRRLPAFRLRQPRLPSGADRGKGLDDPDGPALHGLAAPSRPPAGPRARLIGSRLTCTGQIMCSLHTLAGAALRRPGRPPIRRPRRPRGEAECSAVW